MKQRTICNIAIIYCGINAAKCCHGYNVVEVVFETGQIDYLWTNKFHCMDEEMLFSHREISILNLNLGNPILDTL